MDNSEGCPIDRKAIDAAKMFLETVDLKKPYIGEDISNLSINCDRRVVMTHLYMTM